MKRKNFYKVSREKNNPKPPTPTTNTKSLKIVFGETKFFTHHQLKLVIINNKYCTQKTQTQNDFFSGNFSFKI